MENRAVRGHMSSTNRAKQFMPFAALKGLPEALEKKEKVIMPKMDLSEDYREELDRTFRQIHYKDMLTVVYFHDDNYVKITGMVSKIDTDAGYIQIVNTKIAFDDIVELIL